MKVLFVLPRMVMGGVERITLNLIRQLQSQGIECALALQRCNGELLGEAERLTLVHEIARDGLHRFVPRLAKLMHEWHPTHVVVAFADICLLTLAARRWARCDVAIVFGVHNAQGIETARRGVYGWARHKFDRRIAGFVYRNVDAIVATSAGVERELRTSFVVPANRLWLIHNPVVSAENMREISSFVETHRTGTKRIVAMGRLVRQKGFDVLVEAMAEVGKQRRDWNLRIYGDGPDQLALAVQIEALHLADRVSLEGNTMEPIACLLNADVFVLSSRHEGLPTALIQAVACGVQIVATDCPFGPREILQDGALGVLVRPEELSALADAICRVLSGESWVDAAALRARARDFTVEESAAHWLAVLHTASRMRGDASTKT
jgi:glycosyltransferase involved in cell wall biosynthesis